MSGDYDVDGKAFWTAATVVAVIAALAGMVTQVVLELIFDVDLVVGAGGNAGPLGMGSTFVVAFVIAIAAAGLLHLFLAAVPRGRTFWQLLASLVLVASVVPITQVESDGENKLLLLVVHLVVYLFTVPTLSGLVGRVATPRV
jgi:low temperature requirement protein LtrA